MENNPSHLLEFIHLYEESFIGHRETKNKENRTWFVADWLKTEQRTFI